MKYAALVLMVIIGSSMMTTYSEGMDLSESGLIFMSDYEDMIKDQNITEAMSGYLYGADIAGRTGWSVASIGDVNGDGNPDIAIGSIYGGVETTDGGRVDVVFGGKGGITGNQSLSESDITFFAPGSNSLLGTALARPADLNGDGLDDIIMSSPYLDHGSNWSVGGVFIFFGSTTGLEGNISIDDADVKIIGDNSGQYLGIVISKAGDVNGDSIDDLIIGSARSEAFLIMGKSSGWQSLIMSSDADTIFQSSESSDYFGYSVSGGGDVNGDGFDDIIISAYRANCGVGTEGKTYLFMGSSAGFGEIVNAYCADGSWIGEIPNSLSGRKIFMGGDMNGDGLSDMIISCPFLNSGTNRTGKVYLILGMNHGFEANVSLKEADGSWVAENIGDYLGMSVSIMGDYNADGLDDLLISAPSYKIDGDTVGKVYLILGKGGHFDTNVSINETDASFIGYKNFEQFGCSVSGAGQFSSQGGDDIMIGASFGMHNGENRGIVYFIDGVINFEPIEIHSISLFSDPGYSEVPEHLERGNGMFIEIKGEDCNRTHMDSTRVNISYSWNPNLNNQVNLRETDIDSGTYRGWTIVPSTAPYPSTIEITSAVDESYMETLSVHTAVIMGPDMIQSQVIEGQDYEQDFENLGYSTSIIWDLSTDADWLSINEGNLHGSPDNSHVGEWEVDITLSCAEGRSITREFTIDVINKDPEIITTDVLHAVQDEVYYVDYDSNEDGQGPILWHITTDSDWLNHDPETGELFGTPDHSQTGKFDVSLWVEDGNGGYDRHNFEIIVEDVNDPPHILNDDRKSIDQDRLYKTEYSFSDLDMDEEHYWALETDATWLTIDPLSGILSGRPGPGNIGVFDVKVTLTDSRGLLDRREFTVTVNNVNDPPEFQSYPESYRIDHGDLFRLDINATDPDIGDRLTYSISTNPPCQMNIDKDTGEVLWRASVHYFEKEPYRMKVTLKVSDGQYTDSLQFDIIVEASNPPKTELIEPSNGLKVPMIGNILKWKGTDPEDNQITYDVYLSETKAFVMALKENTLLVSEYGSNEIELDGFKGGKTYFWTVIPNDGCSRGKCDSGIWSFTLNGAPKIEEVPMQKAIVGEKLRIYLKAADPDDKDEIDLCFSLIQGPEGMGIDPASGSICWTPTKGQEMMHKVVVGVTDGTEMTQTSFMIEVDSMESGGGASGSVFIIGISAGTVLLLTIAVLSVVVMRKKRKVDGDEVKESQVSPKEEEATFESVSSRYCHVTISAEEAHLGDQKAHRVLGYEDLYGTKDPSSSEEGMTRGELKKYIGETIKELEKIEE